MMIFDNFPSAEQAHEFAKTVVVKFGLDSTVYNSVEQAQEADPFPYVLIAPVVHVERSTEKVEQRVEALVGLFGGEYAGT